MNGRQCVGIIALAALCAANPAVAVEGTASEDARVHQLMPVPASVEWREGRLAVAKDFAVAAPSHRDQRLAAAIDRALRRLEGRLGVPLSRAVAADATGAELAIEVTAAGSALPALGDDESYELEIDATRAVLRAPAVVGALRGIETVLQLLEGGRDGWYLPAVRVVDRPRFAWRGLMIDVARHWIPPEVVKRNLDGMAAVKLNVLHLHLTEDQGFRIESKRFPKLHGMGSDGLFYTQDQIRDVVGYATERGIRVVPEFDIPGHATSWLVGHPELASAPGPYQIERKWGIFDPTIDPTREETYRFFDRFLGEMAALFPDRYMHIGGDENNGKQWKANVGIQAFMKDRGIADEHALQAYFNQRISKILTKYGKTMVGWDEILHPDLPKDIVVHSWRGQESLAAAARQGYAGILSNGYYIDLVESTERHYRNDPLPAGTTLSDDEARRILGGEATMWAEFVDPVTIDTRIWPRLAAIAERLWSPREVNDVEDMYRRLERVSVQLEEHGLQHLRTPPMLIRRLAHGGSEAALATLVALVEPVEGYRRSQLYTKAYGERPTQMTPLSRLVDAAAPDSAEGRRVAMLASRLVDDLPRFERGREELARIFTAWTETAMALGPTVAGAPALAEAAPLVDGLRELASIGLTALAYLAQAAPPPPAWDEQALSALARIAEPVTAAQVELVVVQPVRQLVAAASLADRGRRLTADQWRQSVTEKAALPKAR